LTGRSRCLLDLGEIRHGSYASAIEGNPPGAETRPVPIAQIVGSQGRCVDFDRDFHPLHDHNRERWLRIAAARQRGTLLPPVDLVQVGDLYYVQDGHHRISVARALGQLEIEARVTVWHVRGPLPWEIKARPSTPLEQETLVGRLGREILAYVRARLSDRRNRALRGGSHA
jgi:hypothetical protein